MNFRNPASSQQNQAPNHSMPLSQRAQIQCNFCKKLGHTETECFAKSGKTQNFQTNSRTGNPLREYILHKKTTRT